jgi:hypothetical protein
MTLFGKTIIGLLTTALTFFLVKKAASVLLSLGLSVVIYVGIDNLFSRAVSHIQSSVGAIGAISFGGYSVDVVGLLGAAGVWAAINIVLSGYSALIGIKSLRLFFVKAI